MKTIIYTYRNRKPVFFELDRYYLLKTGNEYTALVDMLLDIDAVSVPFFPEDRIKFPVLLELKPGFAPHLILANPKNMKREELKSKSLRNGLTEKRKTKRK